MRMRSLSRDREFVLPLRVNDLLRREVASLPHFNVIMRERIII